MAGAAFSRALTGRSMVASVALHGMVALWIPALIWLPSDSSAPVETISFVRVAHIQIAPQRQPKPAPKPVAPRESVKIAIAAPIRVELARTTSRRKATPLPDTSFKDSSAPAVADVPKPGTGNVTAEAAPPQPTAPPVTRAVASVAGRDTGGNMPFGAEQPDPVLDPNVLRQLAGLGVHVTILVTVGDDGRTKTVAFETPVDGQIESHIQALLADASWDPAVCGGGIACEGRATIKL